jgi:hypothetical protein
MKEEACQYASEKINKELMAGATLSGKRKIRESGNYVRQDAIT